jgi:hypothetical protein
MARINIYILDTKCGLGKGQYVSSNKVSFLKGYAMKGIQPHHLESGMIRDTLV